MPSVKRAVKSQEVKSGFEAFDGPPITRRGFYRAKIRAIKYRVFKSDADGLYVFAVLEAAKGDPKKHKQFDGMPISVNLVFGDAEALLNRESNFYAALGLADNPAIVFPAGDPKSGTGLDVSSLGGKKLAQLLETVVNLDIKLSTQEGYEGNAEVDGIYKYKDVAMSAGDADEDDADETEDDEADITEDDEAEEADESDEAEGDDEYAEEEARLNGLALPALRNEAKALGITLAGLKKDGLVEAILEATFTDEEEADEEEEEDDEAEDDGRGAREEELGTLSRAELKVIIKNLQPDFTVLKRHEDSDLVAAIIDSEFGEETPF